MSIALNDGQRVAYDSTARIVVVPACPGSGKTRLFVATVLKEFNVPRKSHQGVAAISFTNAAEQEISSRLPSGVSYPNFVGTIDSFLLRYVVRPFGGNLINLKRFRYPSSSDDFPVQDEVVAIPGQVNPVRLAKIDVVRTNGASKVLYEKEEIIDTAAMKAVAEAKKLAWQRGEVLHNDVCFIASLLLEDEGIRKVVLERFASVLVDEFQDIAGSRETAILKLLRDQRLNKGFVVGDPNQCIMQFTGARADLFQDASAIPGAFTTPLTETHRFNAPIGNTASHLALVAHEMQYAREPVHQRHTTVLLTHDRPVREEEYAEEIQAFVRFLQVNNTPQEHGSPPAVLVRKTKLANRLRGEFTSSINFSCRTLETLYQVVSDFRLGKMSEVQRATQRVLCTLCEFEGVQPTDEELESKGLTQSEWKQKVWHVALAFSKFGADQTLDQWIVSGRTVLQTFMTETGSTLNLGARYRVMRTSIGEPNMARTMTSLVETAGVAQAIQFSNIHQSKGREYPAACILIPKPAKNEASYLPSWFQNPQSEEARIAYVALTRPKHGLLVILPQSTIDEFEAADECREFLDSFQYRGTVNQYLRDFPDPGP